MVSPEPTPAVEVDLDRGGQVHEVRLARLTDALRDPATLDRAVRQAQVRAFAGPGRDRAAERTATGGRTRPVAGGPGPRRTPPPYGTSTATAIADFRTRWDARPGRHRTAAAGPRSGTSSNGCVVARRDGAIRLAEVEVDPGWLRQAGTAQVARALTEAFRDLATHETHEHREEHA